MTKYKLQIFETNRLDGCMSQAKKFYPSNYTEQEIKDKLQEVKEKIGKKYHFNGNHILQPQQKEIEKTLDYPDGKYIRITKEKLTQEDYWYLKFPCDILLIGKDLPNIVIGHRMADCPVIIAEDIKHQVVAVSHCGAVQINREVPRYTIEALIKEIKSNPQDIHVYIGSCIKKESYQYDRYPHWATNHNIWKDCITKKENTYYIDLVKAIKKQLQEKQIPAQNITESPYDTYTSKDYYSHTEEVKKPNCNIGQNFVGCFYKALEE